MEEFTYARAADAPAALKELQGDSRARYLAGGTTLIDLMKLNVETPRRVVDINHLPLTQIEVTDAGVRVGALVRNSDMAYHEAIRTRYPVLSQALLSGATPQIRNMATLAGNLLQRTRCTYFRDLAWGCNKRQPGSGCAAIDGYNRMHAVLGTSDKCIATHPSDMCVALVALDAMIVTQKADGGGGGGRKIPIVEFYVPYGDDPAKENTLQPGELITAVELPNTAFFTKSHYLKVRDRASFEFALVSAAVALDIQGGAIRTARLALGGVATKPWRAADAEKALVGGKAEETTFARAAQAALAGARPQKFNAFKIELAKRCIVRALSTVAAMG
jgi:xanthine dehydrogenase YagS FAD-binding subunit